MVSGHGCLKMKIPQNQLVAFYLYAFPKQWVVLEDIRHKSYPKIETSINGPFYHLKCWKMILKLFMAYFKYQLWWIHKLYT